MFAIKILLSIIYTNTYMKRRSLSSHIVRTYSKTMIPFVHILLDVVVIVVYFFDMRARALSPNKVIYINPF